MPVLSSARFMSPSEPRVSVIVRTRDRPAFLAEALGSLRAQNYRDFEIVVVNDGGATPAIPDDLGVACRVVPTTAPHGRARALNTGVDAARGFYVAYLDDDDLLLPDHLEKLARFLDGSDQYQAAYTDVEIVEQALGDDGRYVERGRRGGFGRDFVAGRIQFSNFVPLISLMHQRSLFERAGRFDETFDLFEDWDFLIRLTTHTRLHRLQHTTALYRVRNDGTNAVTTAPWQGSVAQEARKRIFEKHWQLHTPEAEMALIDGFERELTAAIEWQPRAIQAEQYSAEQAGMIASLQSDLATLHASLERAERAERLSLEQASLIARLQSDILALRADSARTAQLASEHGAHMRNELTERLRQASEHEAALAATLQSVHNSFAWRLFTPWWRFKAWLRR